jgi:dihydrofolate synthase/folylpolyglutamate synthase
VLRAGRPAVTSADGEALAVVRRRASEIGANLIAIDDTGAVLRDRGWEGVEVAGLAPAPIRTPLLGRHQARNLAAAALAARAWGVGWDAVADGAASVRWPGRLERIDAHGCRWLLDGAHNPAGARALAAALQALDARVAVALVGVTEERLAGDLPGELGALAPLLVATRAASSPRSAAAAGLGARLRASAVGGAGVLEADDVAGAVELAAAAAAATVADGATAAGPPTIVVAGSLFLVGEVRAHLLGEAQEGFERWQ